MYYLPIDRSDGRKYFDWSILRESISVDQRWNTKARDQLQSTMRKLYTREKYTALENLHTLQAAKMRLGWITTPPD